SAGAAPDRHGLVDGLIGRSLLRRPLVGLGDGDELLDAGELLDLADRQTRDVAVDADQGDLGTDQLPGLVAETGELLLDRRDLVPGRVRPHLDEHGFAGLPCDLCRRHPIAIEGGAMRQEAAKSLVLALDVGTTGVRALLLDASGTPRAEVYREVLPSCPAPGLVEHDTETLFRATADVLGQAPAAAPRDGARA